MLKKTKIINYKHFIDLTNEFDNRVGTRTVWARLTMRQIYDHILKEDSWGDVDYQIKRWVTHAFSIKNSFWHDDMDIPQSRIGKMNSIWLIIQDIKAGKLFHSPLCMSLFANGKTPIHAGGTRLILADVYKRKIDLCVTDYRGDIRTRYPNIKWKDIDKYDYDFSNLHEFNEDITGQQTCKTYSDPASGESILIKQITTFMVPTTNMYNYHHPRIVDTPRHFLMEDNMISVNGDCIAKLDNGIWKIIIDN